MATDTRWGANGLDSLIDEILGLCRYGYQSVSKRAALRTTIIVAAEATGLPYENIGRLVYTAIAAGIEETAIPALLVTLSANGDN